MFSVIAKIDRSSRARLSWLQSFGASFGIVPRPIYGHITLASFEGGDEAELIARCKDALEGTVAFDVAYNSIEVLSETDTVAAMPGKAGMLVEVYEKITAVCPEQLDWWTKPGAWLPHTTLVHDTMTNLRWVKMAMDENFQPFTARIERIEFSRVTDNGYEIVDTMELKGE